MLSWHQVSNAWLFCSCFLPRDEGCCCSATLRNWIPSSLSSLRKCCLLLGWCGKRHMPELLRSHVVWCEGLYSGVAVLAVRNSAAMLATMALLTLPAQYLSLWLNASGGTISKTMDFCLMLYKSQKHSFSHILLGSDVQMPLHGNRANEFKRIIPAGQWVRALEL